MPDSVVRIEAPARLHFGMLDLRGSLGRRFGGIGAGVFGPSLLIEIERASAISAEGPSADRAAEFARRYLDAMGIDDGARIVVRRAIPEHCGLGSGTQLALAVAHGIALLHDLSTDVSELAQMVDRGKRSAIGSWLYAGGGFVLEGGRHETGDRIAPLLTRLSIPASWRCVLVLPASTAGASGIAEAQAFRTLPAPPLEEVEHVAQVVLMSLLPALADGELDAFGRALTEIQQINGRWFAPAQGGPFASGLSTELIGRMSEWGAAGVGQSSWGPAIYSVVAGDDAAAHLADRIRNAINERGEVYVNQFADTGARVTVCDPIVTRR